MYNLNSAISVIQDKLGINLSREQLEILNYRNREPILTDACAGSGKTTLMLINVIILYMTGKAMPWDVLCVTFSKAAQLNMKDKYTRYMKLIGFGNPKYHPYFTTFHALFKRLIDKAARHYFPVMASWKMIKYDLSRAIKFQPTNRTKAEVLKDIFNLYGSIINDQKSYNGLDLIGKKHQSWNNTVKVLDKVANEHHMAQDSRLYADYHSVIADYNRYKKQHGLVDFNDMKTKLYQDMKNEKLRHQIRHVMHHFNYVFIDEFQDIDKLQWTLIRSIISDTALLHLMVIGDDDQSIYAFRGGDPDIMLNYHRYLPNAKIFHLSTNYRTGGNILAAVRPLICNNKYRYKKHLLANKSGQGRIIEFRGRNAERLMFRNLLDKIRNPNIPNSQIVVLVRYNTARMFVIDWLAKHGHYIHVRSARRDILQSNYVYKIFYQLIQSIYNDSFEPFVNNSTRIGFYKYKSHVNNVVSEARTKITKLSQYLKCAQKFDSEHFKADDEFNFSVKDRLVRALLDARKQQSLSGKELWSGISALTNKYFNYMIQNEFIRSTLVREVQNIFKNDLSCCDNIGAFLTREMKQDQILSNRSDVRMLTPHPINVLSLHQSKGLQFKYVYLYGLTDRQVKPYMVRENSQFAPNINRESFMRKFLNLSPKQTIDMDSFNKDKGYQYTKNAIVKSLANIVKRDEKQPQLVRKKASEFVNLLCKNKDKSSDVQKAFNKIYIKSVRESKFVEEERRLIYVGVTRAEKGTYICMGMHTNPLLKEIKVPTEDAIRR